MKVIFHHDFYTVYTSDPAAAAGRMEAVVETISGHVDFVEALPAAEGDILTVHTQRHVDSVRRSGLYPIAALAAGGAVQAAEIGLSEPCFALIRPPGHHASADAAWGFCFFNNMSIALEKLKRENRIETAYVLDFDLHFGDGNVNILGDKHYVRIFNPDAADRKTYMKRVADELEACQADLIGISAGFDYHRRDWGGLLATKDYAEIGQMVRDAAQRCHGGSFAILEGGYNHDVLGPNVLALIQGLSDI
jgi:acetoin utilization deacetylase AcuC-like enzyme